MPIFQDLSGRAASTRTLRIRGAIAALALTVVSCLLFSYSKGYIRDDFELKIDAATLGEGLAAGAEVKFRGLGIGKVTKIETLGYGHQLLELAIDRNQATALTDNVSARFTSSNVFGSTAIELVNSGGGAQLHEGKTLLIGANSTNATVTGVLRRASELTELFDSDAVRALLDTLAANSQAVGPILESFFDVASLIADNQSRPLADLIRGGASVLQGASDVTEPMIALIQGILDSADYLADPEQKEKVRRAISGLDKELVKKVGDLLNVNNANLATVIDAALDVAAPIIASAGTIAPTYNRIGTLLDRVKGAFPVIDGKVQLQLDVIATDMPYLLDSLPAGAR
jgi:phospholipid/cholesterol/gamma-HCH transport system substrate-binding protein